jgi:hypothetical protein
MLGCEASRQLVECIGRHAPFIKKLDGTKQDGISRKYIVSPSLPPDFKLKHYGHDKRA